MLVTGGCFNTSGSPLALWLYSSEQYSVHLLRMSLSSVRRFPFLSYMVSEALPIFVLYGEGMTLL